MLLYNFKILKGDGYRVLWKFDYKNRVMVKRFVYCYKDNNFFK